MNLMFRFHEPMVVNAQFKIGGPAIPPIIVPMRDPNIEIKKPWRRTILKVNVVWAPTIRKIPNSRIRSSILVVKIELMRIPVINMEKNVSK